MSKNSDSKISAQNMLDSVLESRFSGMLYALIKLKIPELTLSQPITVSMLALQTGSHQESLERLLRACAARKIFTKSEKGYQLTSDAYCLLQDHEASVSDILLWIFEWKRKVWDEVVYSIKTGKPAFDKVYGKPLFDFLAEHPQAKKLFNSVMTQRTQLQIPKIATAYPFEKFSCTADIGGGKGHLLAAVLEKQAGMKGILFDNSEINSTELNHDLHTKLSTRFTRIKGNFFRPFSLEADLFILKEVLHDWSDSQAIQILKHTASNMKPENRLLIMEYLRADNDIASLLLDMAMLLTTGGKERSIHEFEELISKAGLEITNIYRTESNIKIIECKTA